MLVFNLIGVILCVTALCDAQTINFRWIEDVVGQIKHDGSIFRIVLLVNQTIQEETSGLNYVQRKIVQELPCIMTDIQADVFTNKTYLPKYNNHLLTTLVISLHYLKKDFQVSQEEELKMLLSQISEYYEQPKCLFITFLDEEEFDNKFLLRYGWSKNLLQFTILEHVERKIVMKRPIEKMYSHHVKAANTVYYLNPFSNVSFKEAYSNRLNLFPDKLRNMYGYKMRVAAISAPPNTYIARTASGNVTAAWGFEGITSSTFAKGMNFIPEFIPIKGSGYGALNCNINKTAGFVRYILENRVRFGFNHGPFFLCGKKLITVYSRVTGYMQFYPVVPILKSHPAYFTASTDSLKAIGVIVALMVLVKITLYKFKFDKYYHQLLNMFSLSIGNGLLQSPDKDSQRIVFCFLLLGFWVFSSDIYGVLTDLQMVKDEFVKLDTLEEIHAYNLTPMMPANTRYVLSTLGVSKVYDELLKRAVIKPLQRDCMLYLMKHMNVTCVMPLESAKMYIEELKVKYNFREMTIGKEYFIMYYTGVCFEPTSPYAKGVDRVLSRLTDSGLIEKWTEDYAPTPEVKKIQLGDDGDSGSSSLITLILFVLIVGLGSSFLLFIGELLFHRRSTMVRRF